MDLISREAIYEKEITNPENDYEYGWNEALAEVDADIPSAFEGMTNGEVIQALFPNAEIEYWAEYSTYNIEFPNDNDVKHFSYSWWNAPYQKGGEDKE